MLSLPNTLASIGLYSSIYPNHVYMIVHLSFNFNFYNFDKDDSTNWTLFVIQVFLAVHLYYMNDLKSFFVSNFLYYPHKTPKPIFFCLFITGFIEHLSPSSLFKQFVWLVLNIRATNCKNLFCDQQKLHNILHWPSEITAK